MFVCPVCGCDQLEAPPYFEDECTGTWASYEACPCCGFAYGYSDYDQGWTHEAWRARWLAEGAGWAQPDQRPDNWDLPSQLSRLSNT